MPSSEEELARKARETLDKLDTFLIDYKGECENCVFRSRGPLGSQICHNPIVQSAALLVPQGSKRITSVECDYQRGSSTIYGPAFCGPKGLLFEPLDSDTEAAKSAKESWWSKFVKFLSRNLLIS